jgi:pSer/pThr/pTyr-binding forkhead associated (FHA) protein
MLEKSAYRHGGRQRKFSVNEFSGPDRASDMHHLHEPLTASQPALVPMHGIQEKKPRLLDRDSTIIGRARGCDICVDSPDVSNLHCVITRTPEGFDVRDCGSRAGTKINGESIKGTAPLQDGDLLQVGLYCFRAQIPAEKTGQGTGSAKVEHLQKSRRRLALHGLRLRRKLIKFYDVGVSRTPTELSRKAAGLKNQIRSYDQRLAELEQTERELVQERDKLRQEQETHRSHVQQMEMNLGQRLGDADAEIRKRWQEFQQRCQKEEARLVHGGHGPQSADAPNREFDEKLKKRSEELDQFARELQEEQQRQTSARQELDNELATLHKQQQELTTMQKQLNCQQATADSPSQTSLASVEAGLNEQRENMARMMADMEKIQKALLARQDASAPAQSKPADDARLRDLKAKNGELQTRVAELEKLLAKTHADNKDLNDLCGDHELLRQLLKDEPGSPASNVALEKLKAENECLSQLLQSKEQEIGTLKKDATPVAPGTLRESDLENYEAELNQYRRQLDTDRAKLNVEIEQVRQRNVELDESVRDMEMDMSRERAELARERMRLDRLREEVRIEMERLQRDGGVRESLVSVQKLREEMNKAKGATPGGPMGDRLKGSRT